MFAWCSRWLWKPDDDDDDDDDDPIIYYDASDVPQPAPTPSLSDNNRGAERLLQLSTARFEINDRQLCVKLPRKVVTVDYYDEMTLALVLDQRRNVDNLTGRRFTCLDLAIRYPDLFWNAMFHYASSVERATDALNLRLL